MAIQIPAPRQAVTEIDQRTEMAIFTRPWFLFLQGLLGNRNAPSVLSVVGSPFSYNAPDFGMVAITGGTVSAIELGRNGVFVNVGFTSGLVPVSQSDVVRVTHSVTPAIAFISR